MSESILADDSLIALLQASDRPIYAVDDEGRIAFCNPALERWLDLAADRILGRIVEYHSEIADDPSSPRSVAGPVTGLCPPPQALAGEPSVATVSCSTRDGRLRHRRADFVPLHVSLPPKESASKSKTRRISSPVIAFLADEDMSPLELSLELSAESSSDELHRAIRRFRRNQAGRYAIESLIGDSSAMRKLRSQVMAAAVSGANVLITGRRGSGHAPVARAIHYQAGDDEARLLTMRGGVTSAESLRRTVESLSSRRTDAQRSTLLIEELDRFSSDQQALLFDQLRRAANTLRLIATIESSNSLDSRSGELEGKAATPELNRLLRDLASTITIELPRLVDRLEDLPILSQFFLEAANRGRSKQVGGIRPPALDLLALYSWPDELDELRDAITSAHTATVSTTIGPADLPAVIHHAAKAAAVPRRPRERIALEALLTGIEKEAIVRALSLVGGNKSEAAELLGLTRPRLYRRMEQLGLAPVVPKKTKPPEDESLPDFREIGPEDSVE
jgi:DNA-binding NtrC family response regulator